MNRKKYSILIISIISIVFHFCCAHADSGNKFKFELNKGKIKKSIQNAGWINLINSYTADCDSLDFVFPTTFERSNFIKPISFKTARFLKEANFISIICKDSSDFTNSKFYNNAFFKKAQFLGTTNFIESIFAQKANFRESIFGTEDDPSQIADFKGSTFSKETDFTETIFYGNAYFMDAKILDKIYFTRTTFSKDANFNGTRFFNNVFFENTKFLKNIDIANVNFNKEVDLTTATFDGKIYFSASTSFPNGELKIPWDKLDNRLELSPIEKILIQFNLKPINKKSLDEALDEAYYHEIEIFYKKLHDNYLAQNDKSSANKVMYKLAEIQRGYLKNTFFADFYGTTFGFGYKPFRYILICIFFIIPFFALWYYFLYYNHIAILLDKTLTIDDIKKLSMGEKKILNIFFDHKNCSPGFFNIPTRICHVLFFSTSVLAGLRFKKEWIIITKKDQKFFNLVIIEWCFGIILYIFFIMNIASSQFDNIKDILQW